MDALEYGLLSIWLPLMPTRHNPVIRTVYTNAFFKVGKAKKVALVACVRKLLCILNAMRKHQQPWNLNPAIQIS